MINGWRIADSDDFDFSVEVNGEKITQIDEVDRPDVASVYEEEYAGYVEDRKLGFTARFTPHETGQLTILAQISAGGKHIADKQITVTVG